jgi:hypothetical protein
MKRATELPPCKSQPPPFDYGQAREMKCHQAQPGDRAILCGDGHHGGVGLNDHIKDVTERIAAEGYVTIAPTSTTENLPMSSATTNSRRPSGSCSGLIPKK